MFGLTLKPARTEAASLIVRDRPRVALDTAAIHPTECDPDHVKHMAEYAVLTKTIGFAHPYIEADLKIEAFKAFLRQRDWGIFSLRKVVKYMDQKAADESSAKSGWLWRPLREMDHLPDVQFGTPASHTVFQGDGGGDSFGSGSGGGGGSAIHKITPASDFYDYGKERDRWGEPSRERVTAYDRLVPLHALRKVLDIKKSFEDEANVSFFVSDYAPAPHIEYPDPFLMAVINNAKLNRGVGRFVIDFWDEPGFGLAKQL